MHSQVADDGGDDPPVGRVRSTLTRWIRPGAVDPAAANWNVVGRAATLVKS
ncbi:hypothetical protein ABZY10_25015 [Streptomyces sp. NPDC006539]|uniref:hypothetical protein n=1 Tax=Streptomyces TaxID=1883 RepID=UPI00339960D6